MLPTTDEIRAAAARLHGVIAMTPLTHAPALSALVGGDVWLKEEQRQTTGSFKLRGAYNALAALPPAVRSRGVVASSAGNHGLGVAHAARALGIQATVFIPASAPAVKREGIAALGAVVDATQPDYDAAHHAAERFADDTGRAFVNPCAGERLLAGQGTVALEIMASLPSVATVVVPVGGGGLVGGMAVWLRAEAPHVRIVGAQGDQTAAMATSLARGRRIDVAVPPTLADGLAGQIDDVGYAIGRMALDAMVTVSEAEIAAAIAWVARNHGARVEGSGAVAVAALLGGHIHALASPVVVVLTGGNIDAARWNAIVHESP
jgi:threonine dehydratase